MAFQTSAEKILSRASGGCPVAPGDEIYARPDFVLAYDFPGYLDRWFHELRHDHGIDRVAAPDRFAFFIDHTVPGAGPADSRIHQITRDWCREQEVALYERAGIGHQVAVELGYAVPGSFSIHFDGHTAQLGACGALSIGVHKQILEALVSETILVRVPRTTRVILEGELQPGMMARDVFHHMVRAFGPAFARFQVLELDGPAVAGMPLDSRQAITGLAMFAGAITAIMPSDEEARKLARVLEGVEPVWSDPGARLSAEHRLDLSSLAPVVVAPPSPANTRLIDDAAGLAVQTGYIGSCSSGRIEDLRMAATILRGREVAPGFRLNIVPTSQAVFRAACAEGLVETLLAAGAHITGPTCDLCYGRIPTVGDGERAISTGTLNTPGRMGSVRGEIWLASAATVAASAIEGRIADPRNYLA